MTAREPESSTPGSQSAQAWVENDACLVCPRHRWRFDLAAGGRCVANGCSIDARAAEPRAPEAPAGAETLAA